MASMRDIKRRKESVQTVIQKAKSKNRESVQRIPVLRRMRKALICGEIQISQWERNAVLSLPYLSGPSREVLSP